MFNDFMKNSYWKELYNNSSENLKKYYTFKFNNNDKEYTESMIKELEKIRGNFTKSDWEQLISQSSGRAKYEYTRMMKERFPD